MSSTLTAGGAAFVVTGSGVAESTQLSLGAVLARAGEGTIYELAGRTDLVAKVFHPTLSGLSGKLDKVAAMVDRPPPGAVQPDGFVVLTWPQQVLWDAGRPVGYLMARVDTATAVEIHTLSNPFNRANPLPGTPQWTANATWAHLVAVAANLCLAVQVVHRVDAVIGDFQERNIFVCNTTQVTLVDCDSMQFTDRAGRQFLCRVGRSEFTAPELAGADLRTHARDQRGDLFALAVHIYQLLLAGNHPFMRGQWVGAGEQPSALELAAAGCWAGGPGSALQTHPLAPPTNFLPPEIIALFTRAFTDGAKDPSARPTAAQWRTALLNIHTTTCAQGTHHIPTTTPACPWCAIDTERTRRKEHSAKHEEQQGVSPTPDGSRRSAGTSASSSGRSTAGAHAGSPGNHGPGGPPKRQSFVRRRLAGRLKLDDWPTVGILLFVVGVISVATGIFIGDNSANDGRHSADITTTTTPGSSDASSRAISDAEVGDCISRVMGTQRSDGSLDVTVRPAVCGSTDATDKVVKRTDNIANCNTQAWVRTGGNVPTIVLCLASS